MIEREERNGGTARVCRGFSFGQGGPEPQAVADRGADRLERLSRAPAAGIDRRSRPAGVSCAGPVLGMFKALLLAQWYQLSDPALEEALADRISFRRFCGFALDVVTPDETTFCRFRQSLAQQGLGERLMAELDRQLGRGGFLVKEGTMIDATLIAAQASWPADNPGQRAGTAGQKSSVEDCTAPDDQAGQKFSDPDARFAKQGEKTVYGYKAHVAVDLEQYPIRRDRLSDLLIG